jgi:hypothetical protein
MRLMCVVRSCQRTATLSVVLGGIGSGLSPTAEHDTASVDCKPFLGQALSGTRD